MISLLQDDWRKSGTVAIETAPGATAESAPDDSQVGRDLLTDSIDYFQIEGAKARERLEGRLA